MKKRIFNKLLIGLVIIFLLFVLLGFSNKIFADTNVENKIYCNATLEDDFSENRVLVVLDKTSSYSDITYDKNDFLDYGCVDVNELTYLTTSLIKTNSNNDLINQNNYNKVLCLTLSNNSKENVLNVIKNLIQRKDVIYAGPDYKISVNSVDANDLLFENQSAIDFTNLPNAWDFTKGNKKILVGIIDSGIDGNHPDLSNSIENSLCCDFTSGTEVMQTNPIDPYGHGTHVAGIIGAVGNNNIGIAGVNWNVGLVSLRVFDEYGMGYSSYVADAINFAIQNEIPILNFSGGWKCNSIYNDYALEDVIDDYNGLLICAAGNKNENNDGNNPLLPASINLPNIISVGSCSFENNKSSFSNYGNLSVDLYAPGEEILSTFPSSICNERDHIFDDGTRLCEISNDFYEEFLYIMDMHDYSFNELENHLGDYWNKIDGSNVYPRDFVSSTHLQNGYHFMSGTSMSSPYVAGTAALLLSLNNDLSATQLKEAILNSVSIYNINGINCLENLCTSEGILNIYNAVKYVLDNYISPSTYILSNYSSTINENKIITNDASYFNELNGFYKLNVTYQKNYEFISSSIDEVEVFLYDEDFNSISYYDLDVSINKVHFVNNLDIGTYYLRVKYVDEDCIGTINTKIVSRNTAYLGCGENDILINTYNSNDIYNFKNNQGPGFYKFTIEAFNENGLQITYSNETLKIFDQNNINLEIKYNVMGHLEESENLSNINYLYMYLERNGYYYIRVDLPEYLYSSIKINIERANIDEIDVLGRYNETFSETLINSKTMTEYATGFSINQASIFNLNVTTCEHYIDNIIVVLFKKEYNSSTNTYYKTEILGDYLPISNISLDLEEGTYYIGYFGNVENDSITITINRTVTTLDIIDLVLVMDPNNSLSYGTEVRYNSGLFGGTTITEGFTRHIYFQNIVGVPSVLRSDYIFYSSNELYATISQFGTVLAKSVNQNQTVTIIAVYKDNPSIVFAMDITILNDTSNTQKTIETSQTINLSDFINGKYKLLLTEENSPYPWIQYYNWSVFIPCQDNDILVAIDNYGYLTTTGTGNATLTGTYAINSNITIIIHLNFI